MFIYVRDTLIVTVIALNMSRQPGIVDIWLTVQCRKLPAIIIGCIYRHNKANALLYDYIQEAIRSTLIRKKTNFILGDFNDDLPSGGNKLPNIIKSNRLTQIINKPTRITPISATLLDVIVTNNPDVIISNDVVPNIIADHDLITATVKISKPKRALVTKTFRHLANYSREALCSLLSQQNDTLGQILLTDDFNRQVDILTNTFTTCLDTCAP